MGGVGMKLVTENSKCVLGLKKKKYVPSEGGIILKAMVGCMNGGETFSVWNWAT